MPEYKMIHFKVGPACRDALKIAVINSKSESLMALLYNRSIAKAIREFAPERVDEVRREMGVDE